MKSIKNHFNDIKSKGVKIIFEKILNLLNTYTLRFFKKFIFIVYLGFVFSSLYKKETRPLNTKKILFVSSVWGKKFEDCFIKFTLSSLLATKNIPLLLQQDYKIKFIISIVPNSDFENTIINKINSIISSEKYEIEFFYYEKMSISMMHKYQIKMFEKSIDENAIIWPAHPDHCYSNGSISNMISMIDSDDCCIGAPIFRVEEDKFMQDIKVSNFLNSTPKEFINTSIKNFHKSLVNSFIDNELNNSWLTGISVKKIGSNNLLVTFIVPNIFAARLNKSDIKFFKKRTYNAYDMSWPSKLLIEKRLRLVSASDIFFAAELTNKDNHIDYNFTKNFNPRKDYKRNLHSGIIGSFTYFINCSK